MCLGINKCSCACSASVNQKRALDPMELELQAVVSGPVWVLRIEVRFSTTAVPLLTAEFSLQTEPSSSPLSWLLTPVARRLYLTSMMSKLAVNFTTLELTKNPNDRAHL